MKYVLSAYEVVPSVNYIIIIVHSKQSSKKHTEYKCFANYHNYVFCINVFSEQKKKVKMCKTELKNRKKRLNSKLGHANETSKIIAG